MQHTFIFILSILLCLGFSGKAQENDDWPAELNTAKDAAYLTELQKEVIFELNKVRSNPKRFAGEYLEELRTAYEGKLYTYPGQETVKSKEGIAPLNECIRVLMKTSPMPVLQPSKGLAEAAADLVADQQRHGGIGHIAHDGSTPQTRIEKYGDWNVCSAEDITYGSFEARQIVVALLIDDGVPNRAHRKNILNPCFRFVGVADGRHPDYLSLCVIDYAGDYKTKAPSDSPEEGESDRQGPTQ